MLSHYYGQTYCHCHWVAHTTDLLPGLKHVIFILMFSLHLQGGEKQGKVQKLSKGEVLMLNIGSMCTGARVIAVRPCMLLHISTDNWRPSHNCTPCTQTTTSGTLT